MRSYPSKYRLHSSLARSLSAAVGFFGFFPFFVGILLHLRPVDGRRDRGRDVQLAPKSKQSNFCFDSFEGSRIRVAQTFQTCQSSFLINHYYPSEDRFIWRINMNIVYSFPTY